MSRTKKLQKDRRHSGWVTPGSTLNVKKEEMIKECLEPKIFYDDWQDYRDGQRDYISDYKKIKDGIKYRYWKYQDDQYKERMQMNNKQKMLIKRREARQNAKARNSGKS